MSKTVSVTIEFENYDEVSSALDAIYNGLGKLIIYDYDLTAATKVVDALWNTVPPMIEIIEDE